MKKIIDIYAAISEAKHCYPDPISEAICSILDKYTEEMPQGKWVKYDDNCIMGDGFLWLCSECDCKIYVDKRGPFPNYCDNCGAKMGVD